MKQNRLIAIDLAKNVFQICALSKTGKIEKNKKVSRAKLIDDIRQYEPTTIAMEACYSSHYWARTFEDMGHTVRLIPAQHVKPFVRGNKNDHNDAIAIAEAASRPNMQFVPVKTVEQQDIQSLHRIRERYVRQRTSLINQTRGILSEYGIIANQGIQAFSTLIAQVTDPQDHRLSPLLKQHLKIIADEFHDVCDRLDEINLNLQKINLNNPLCQLISSIPGIGFINSTGIISAIGNAQHLPTAKSFSVWLGVTPKQHASGDVSRYSGISKRGNPYLRKQLIAGARAALFCGNQSDPMIMWAKGLKERRGANKATVALANRMARLIWTLLRKNERYQIQEA